MMIIWLFIVIVVVFVVIAEMLDVVLVVDDW